MNAAEAARLLSLAAAFDQRTIGEADARAWGLALADIRYEDAEPVVIEHYREQRSRLTVADVVARVRAVRAKRIGDRKPPAPPYEVPEDRWLDWHRAFLRAMGDGLDDDAAMVRVCAEFGVQVPDADALTSRPVAALLAGAGISRPPSR